ncbi:GATOR2 complex protein MIOS-A-like [Acropora muricata]|uniref:GATOR2 complex protein MIOS-A-like n=1 Tax=Acropora muricata TaxID=159855 RepID=UPI0034E3E21D
MSTSKWQVLWSPCHLDRFITFGNEICLYQVTKSQETQPRVPGIKSQVIELSDETSASLVSVLTEIQYLKCVAWYPRPFPENLLAVGQANGKVLLTCIGEDNSPNFGAAREFVPKHSRQCNSVAWNPVETNLLAAGLDKARNDASLLVWDINVQLSVRDSGSQERRHSGAPGGRQSPVTVGAGYPIDPSTTGNRPLAELSTSDPILSMAWSYDHNMLICGQGPKFLRIFDIRDTTRPFNATHTKAVSGVCVDPHVEHRIASFSEAPSPGIICMWDDRNLEKPLMTITPPFPLTAISWSPMRSGLLAAIRKESGILQLYDIQHAPVVPPVYGIETEPFWIERSVQTSQSALSSFTWHPTQENHLLTISPSGHIQDCTIFERISVAWSPSSHLTWGCGKHLLECSQKPAETELEEDICLKMKRRAFAGYGIKHQQVEDIERITGDPKLVKLWKWISRFKSLREQDKSKSLKYDGIKSIISGENSAGAGVLCTRSTYQEQHLVAPVYFSDERKMALSLCGWDCKRDGSPWAEFLKELEGCGQFERAAAVALFNNKIQEAIDILSSKRTNDNLGEKGATLNVVAMALSGFTGEKKTTWKTMCGSLSRQMESPYLRSAFAFLTSEGDNFDSILAEEGMEIEDRVAFACKYLPDSKLSQFLDSLTSKLTNEGDLDGILLTGISLDGINLLEKYVNKTTDVQTASLVIVNCVPHISSEVSKDVRVTSWIENYRNLLDMWRLWHQRALFDIHHNLKDPNHKPPRQVTVTCNFCPNSILTNVQSTVSRVKRHAQYSNPSNRTKIMACPSCRKPLPRCSLCLVHMGTPSSLPPKHQIQDPNAEKPENVRSVNPIKNWLTWCQSCRHGGHSDHIIDWFKAHAECPVTGCGCHCMNLDSIAMAMPVNEVNPSV